MRDRLAAHRPSVAAAGAVALGATPPGLAPAAVLIPLITHAEGLTAIFTRRTAHLAAHAGQISFPGGRVEPVDGGPVATALRETEEEIGLPATRVEVLGCLELCDTTTGFGVIPVVGLVAPPLALRPDPYEVADAFEVPLDYLVDPANLCRERRLRRGRVREVYAIDYQGHIIWGATAHIVVTLAQLLDGR